MMAGSAALGLAQSNANPAKRKAIIEARIPADRSGCWIWTGTKTAAGYGQMRGGPKVKMYVHRVSYETFVGPIPDGKHLDHLCRQRACFNPAHLEVVDPYVNWIRGTSPGAISYLTDRCFSDRHDLTPGNIIWRRDGSRRCRECANEWQRKRRAIKHPRPRPALSR